MLFYSTNLRTQILLLHWLSLCRIKNIRIREAILSEWHYARSKYCRLNIHRYRVCRQSLLRCGGRFSNERTSLTSSLSSQQYRRLVVHQLRRRRTRRLVYRCNPVPRISDTPPSRVIYVYRITRPSIRESLQTPRCYVCGTKCQSKRTN